MSFHHKVGNIPGYSMIEVHLKMHCILQVVHDYLQAFNSALLVIGHWPLEDNLFEGADSLGLVLILRVMFLFLAGCWLGKHGLHLSQPLPGSVRCMYCRNLYL